MVKYALGMEKTETETLVPLMGFGFKSIHIMTGYEQLLNITIKGFTIKLFSLI